ncbi:MAG: glycogen/starch/alpha-glucan phosphorylase [Pseudanabaenaceae cyanobacterium bins.68]|nr:glycogen/starch/alpha-glucan phosphorylase [Pseudanabaenaceae cyanobacterium bins.68]
MIQTQTIDPNCPIVIEDDRTGLSVETLKRAFEDNLFYIQGKYNAIASNNDFYMALAYTMRDRLLQRWLKTLKTYTEQNAKYVYYLSAEFLMGRHLGNSLINLEVYDQVSDAVKAAGLDLKHLLEQEPDPGLGNGGLGRLAACFLDSLATLEIPSMGYGIRYEFGIFNQSIQDGWQVEIPDKWLRGGNPWEIVRYDATVEVKFGGYTEVYHDDKGRDHIRWIPAQTVIGIPHDTPVPGYDTNTVNTLRLWKSEAGEDFNFQAFNAGDYDGAVSSKMRSETISKVLYPNDNTPQGRQLRLEQQFFFVSCSLQDIIRRHLSINPSLTNLCEHAAIQLNDTHPAISIAELMRLLVDEHELDWNVAWRITQKTLAYTNHTLMPEALEKWGVHLFGSLLPRHLQIIYEINHRFLEDVQTWYPGNAGLLERLSLIEEGAENQVRMAHLACVGSHAINGVAALHTDLLKKDVLRDFYQLFPEKFNNKTNGVTPRRWMLLSNPRLCALISEKIGKGWLTHMEDLRQLEQYIGDQDFCDRWRQIKRANKQDLAQYILERTGIEVNPDSLFDIQVKRIHEYKRQHLAIMQVIALYNHIKKNPDMEVVPRTFIFGGKAAPGYFMAKLIIKLINSVANVVNRDPSVRGRLKVVFLPNFSASQGQVIYPAADLSEQISTAGKEASGTGNMKFTMNGACTIGTLDGANIEIREEVGEDNFFLFGLTTEEVYAKKAQGYNPAEYISAELAEVLERIASGHFSSGNTELFKPLLDSLMYHDTYMLFADFQSYRDCQVKVSHAYRDQHHWTKMTILNVARSGKFSSDRTIAEYCRDIWQVQPVKISLDQQR